MDTRDRFSLTWQLVFLFIAYDVRRYRLLMLPAVLEKLSFGVAVVVLFILGRLAAPVVAAGTIDLVFAGLFALAFRRSRVEQGSPVSTGRESVSPAR